MCKTICECVLECVSADWKLQMSFQNLCVCNWVVRCVENLLICMEICACKKSKYLATSALNTHESPITGQACLTIGCLLHMTFAPLLP